MNEGVRMNICIVTNSLFGGGAERVVCNLANFLVNNGHSIRIVLLSNNKKKYDLNESIEVDYISRKSIKNKFILYTLLKKRIASIDADCYLSFLPIPTIFLLKLKKYLNSPLVCAERNDPRHYNPIVKFLLKIYANRSDGFVFQTRQAKLWYGNKVNGIKSIIIPNAINKFDIVGNSFEEKERIVAVGRLVKQKNFEMLIRAFSEVHHKHPEYTLHIYGEGKLYKKLKRIVLKLKLNSHVFFEGFVHNILEELYVSEIFVLSSDYEGMPNVLIEAMSIGKACVSTNCNGVDELIDGTNGIIVDVKDTKGIARAIDYLLDNPKKRIEFGKAAKKIKEKLSSDIIYKSWLDFLTSFSDRNIKGDL